MNGAGAVNEETHPGQHRWRRQLAAWAIPDHISQNASNDPWHLDPELFRPIEPAQQSEPSLATRRAVELLGDAGSALDVGCGGGAATFALRPQPTFVHGVDQSAAMLDIFADIAAERSIDHETTEGSWLDVSSQFETGSFEVVVCHHVAYNVADIGPFVAELRRVARHGVVLELTMVHPQVSNNPLWQQFWHLDRPTTPTALDALAAITEHLATLGSPRSVVLEVGAAVATRQEQPFEARVRGALRMLCLAPERFDEVATALAALPPRSAERAVITVR